MTIIKYIFNVDELHEDQIRLIKAFVSGKNIHFNAPTGNGSPAYKVNHIAVNQILTVENIYIRHFEHKN